MSTASLRTSADFERVLGTGRRARRDGVTVYVARAEHARGPSRLGLAVRCPRAVDRNFVKRRLRGAWRRFDPAPGFEVAIRAGLETAEMDYQELEIHVFGALEAAGLARSGS